MATLRPRARIIRTIGDQLISGPEAALIELVKNAYDADSPWVKIKIVPPSPSFEGGLVQIIDNGHGMTSDEVINRWFEPATNEKVKRTYSRSGFRKLLGAKGIGRFASSRIGNRLDLVSNSLDPANPDIIENTKLHINWDDFQTDQYLDDIDIPVEVKQYKSEGTSILCGLKLDIRNTQIAWTEKALKNIVRELRRVSTPTNIDDAFNIYLDLSAFDEKSFGFDGKSLLDEENFNPLSLENNNDLEPYLIKPYQIQGYADYSVIGKFDSAGAFSGSLTICKGDNIPQEISIPAPPLKPDEKECGPLELKINIYDRENSSIEDLFDRIGLNFSKIGIRKARSILSDNAGLGIYRNGFRIRPYGEPDNDWLRLEGRRVQDPSKKIGHIQISGQIQIQDESESHLVERSSREGLEHNGSFERLKELIIKLLVRIEEKRYDFREKAGLSRKQVGDVSKVKDMASLKRIVSAVTKLPEELQKPLLIQIENESQALTKSLDELEAYQKLLESRAALGLVVSQVIHEGRRLIDPMGDAAKSLINNKDLLLSDSKKGEIVRKYYPTHAETIRTGVRGLADLFKALDPVSGRKRGRPVKFNVIQTIERSIDLLTDAIIESDVSIKFEARESALGYGYESDLQSALLNIIDNAIYWIGTTVNEKKEINISISDNSDFLRILISNSGPPIDEAFLPRLFDAGFSLKTEGHGLGLVISREACRASKGDIKYIDSAIDPTFLIEFPKGN